MTSRWEIPISITALARGFGCKRDGITSSLSHGLEPPEKRGRHQGLSEDREQEIVAWISKYAAKSRPITRRDLRERVAAEYGVPTPRGWVNSFIGGLIGDLCFAKGSPQESQRLEIPRCFLEETLACIGQFVQGRPTELVFNLDEVGISEWEVGNRRKLSSRFQWESKPCITKSIGILSMSQLLHAFQQRERVWCHTLLPLKTHYMCEKNYRKRVSGSGQTWFWKRVIKPYINAECFLDYIRKVFLPNLNELRTLEEFAEEDTVLLMDNCQSHVGEEILRLLRDAKVRIITWAPNTTHIF
jgi:hypothetical protein